MTVNVKVMTKQCLFNLIRLVFTVLFNCKAKLTNDADYSNHIKTHGSELQGQEEAACMPIFRPM